MTCLVVPDMVGPTTQEILPISRFPEAEAFHVVIIITHRRISIWRSMQVQINQLFQISTNDLICVHKYDLVKVHREEHV